MKYKPRVFIEGIELECDFRPSGLNVVVLDDLRVSWGRETLYAPTEPGELTVDLLDPTGAWVSDPTLFGSRIVVQTELGVLFRGRIDSVTMRATVITDESIPVPRPGWAVTLTATDIIADLAKMSAPGWEFWSDDVPVVRDAYRAQYGPGYWYSNDSRSRLYEVTDRMKANGIQTAVQSPDFPAMVPTGYNWWEWFREQTMQAGPDLYSMIRMVQYRSHEPVHSNYEPGPDALRIGTFPPASRLVLSYQDDTLTVITDGPGYAVPSDIVSVAEDSPVSATVESNIGSLKITEARYSTTDEFSEGVSYGMDHWENAALEFSIPNAGNGTAQLTLDPVSVGARVIFGVRSETAADLAAELIPYIEAVNGKLIPPVITFDLERESYGAELERALLATWTTPVAFAFPGALYETLTGWGPMFQRIGADLRFRQGWEVAVRFAPSPELDAETITLAELVTSDAPGFDDYADHVTLTTLGTVAAGV